MAHSQISSMTKLVAHVVQARGHADLGVGDVWAQTAGSSGY